MSKIFSNSGVNYDYVINPFSRLLKESKYAYFATPYFTEGDLIHEAAMKGKNINLLIGLNAATCPKALKKIHKMKGVSIRYFTSRFHAKIFIFDQSALLGSANLTDGGLKANREAVIELDCELDNETFKEVCTLFAEFWDIGYVLTSDKLDAFIRIHDELRKDLQNADKLIEKALGQAQPKNINVESRKKSKMHVFLESHRQEIYEQYQPAFDEVRKIIKEHKISHPKLEIIQDLDKDKEYVTGRLLNYIRKKHAEGEEAWQNAPLRSSEERYELIREYAVEWVNDPDRWLTKNHIKWLKCVKQTFGSREKIFATDKKQLMGGLMAVHAFRDQNRFVKDAKLAEKFWTENEGNLSHVQSTLSYLLYEDGDFIQRFHDILYDKSKKLYRFGKFCALELNGTVNPHVSPPVNGRTAKALRFLGFEVKGK